MIRKPRNTLLQFSTNLFWLLLLVISLVGCGGSGGNSQESISESKIGVFVDSVVAGSYYETSSGLTGYTSIDGEYSYKPGDTITFFVGDMVIGTVTAG